MGYHNGKSEVAIGKALRKYDRNSYFIADKLDLSDFKDFAFDVSKYDDIAELIIKENNKQMKINPFSLDFRVLPTRNKLFGLCINFEIIKSKNYDLILDNNYEFRLYFHHFLNRYYYFLVFVKHKN